MLSEAISTNQTTMPCLAVIEATLASGTLIDTPANAEPSGRKWRVRVFEYGLSKNRYPWNGARQGLGARGLGLGESTNLTPNPHSLTPALLPLQWTERSARAALRHLDGARCFADHTLDGASGSGGGHSVRDLVGFFSEPAIGPRGPEATLTMLESESWARTKLLAAWQAGRMELIGFSVDAVIGVRLAGEGARRVLEVEDIVAIHSVDMVSAASSGGRALDVLESRDSGDCVQPLRSAPDGRSAKSWAGTTAPALWIPESRIPNPDSRTNQKGVDMKHEIQPAPEGQPVPAAEPCAELGPEMAPEIANVREQVRGLRQQISDAVRRQRIAENRLRLDGKLMASRLPKPLAALVASRFNPDGPFGGRELTEEEVEMEIQRVREAYAALSPVGKVVETGRVKVVREPEEKLQMALDRLFNLPVEDSSIPAFHGIREAYVAYTGDGDVSGLLPTQMRIREDITSTTFPDALANTLRRMLLKDYREQDYGVSLIAQSSSVPDFRTQERVRVGYFGDLPTVATESADYTELTAPTDEKASYSVVTFGGIVTITRKMIINDDLGVVPQIVSRLGRSARRTLAQRVFNLMINNPAIYDSVAWFHATHGNLGSTALTATELDVVRTAMRNRTEKDSNKKLGIGPNVLVVPHELEGKARQENMREYLDTSFTPNPVRFMFGANGERIIVSPLLSDANDWYVFASVEEAPTVEVGFLQGRQEPEFFLAEDPASEKVFTSDKIRYKVRHEFEAAVIDYRGAYKEAVV